MHSPARLLRRHPLLFVLGGLIALLALAAPGAAALGRTTAARVAAESPSTTRVTSLTTPKAVALGVVEGLTEYLPVSSTGHLLIAEKILDVGQVESGPHPDKDVTDTYTVVIQIGAILAVLGIFWRRFIAIGEGLIGRSEPGRKLLISLVVAFVPAAVIGKLGDSAIKSHLLRPWPVVAAWVVGGAVILWFVGFQDRLRITSPTIDSISIRQAAIIGVAQCLALWPGTSRSLVTILAALAVGLSLEVAIEFSFLLGFLTLTAATGYELLKNGKAMVDAFGYVNPIIGVVVAGIAAVISVKWMLAWLSKHPLTVFGWYRIGIGAITAVLLLSKTI